MRAGLVTFHAAHHYGAQLQAYALMKAVGGMGVDCEIIDYVRKDTTEGNKLFKSGISARSLIGNAHTALHYGALKKRFNRFESFKNTKMRLSDKFYGTRGEVFKDAPEYDIYICGSDQIWNPLIYKEGTFDPFFFADFARRGRRIAYAPSFGIAEIPGPQREILRRYLDSFDFLSVREKQGEKIIRDISGRDSMTVLDPTLLLTGAEWGAAASEPVYDMPYILCYFISDVSGYEGFIQETAKKTGLPVVSLCGARRVASATTHTVLDAGPEEFISLFKNAAFICTNSFHGTVFSINFGKDFYSFTESFSAEKAVNSRIYNILGTLGLQSRILTADTGMGEFRDRIAGGADHIDYEKAGKLLQQERDASLKYLDGALFAKIPEAEGATR